MKGIVFVILIIMALLFFITPDVDIQESVSHSVEAPEKGYIDTPIKEQQERVEALNIANTIQPSYMQNRIDARGNAKDSVQQANKQMESRDKAIEAFIKP